MPLFIVKSELGIAGVGVFLSAVVIPLILFEQKNASMSAKLGFRFFFFIGYAGLTVICFSLFFIENIIIQLVLLVIGSIFMSFIEPLQDTFFFKQIAKKNEERFYPLFGTARHIGNFLGKVCIATVLLFFSNQYAFLTVGVLMGVMTVTALKIPRKLR